MENLRGGADDAHLASQDDRVHHVVALGILKSEGGRQYLTTRSSANGLPVPTLEIWAL